MFKHFSDWLEQRCSLARWGSVEGRCTRSCLLACVCVGFACIFGRRGSRVVMVVTVFEHFSDWLEQCSNTFQIGSNTVRTLFRSVGTVFEHFSNQFKHCSNTYSYDTGIRLIRCYDRFSSPVGTENRGGLEVREILTTVHREFGGCTHCCTGKPKRREQDRASPRRRGRARSGTAEE